MQREQSKHWRFIYQVPSHFRKRNDAVKNADAIAYWMEKIKAVEEKLKFLEIKTTIN